MSGLRDFLLGAKQLEEGTAQYAKSTQDSGIANARAEFQQSQPGLLQQLRASAGDPTKQAQLAGQYQNLIDKGGIKDDPYSPVIAKMLFKPTSGSAKPLDVEQIKTLAPWATEDQATDIAKMEDPKLQQKSMDSLGVHTRSMMNLGDRQTARKVNYGKDFNKSLSDQEIKIDDSVKGLTQAVAQFKKNPNKSSLQQLAVSMARAGGDTGVLSNQDLNAYKMNTVAQDIEGLAAYVKDTPEDSITPSVKKALLDMAEFGLANADKRKKDRLESLAKSQFSVYHKDLMKDGKPSPVLQEWGRKTGLSFGLDKDGSPTVTKVAFKVGGKNAKLMEAASKIKDETLKNKYINYFNQKKDTEFTDDQVNHLLDKMKGQ